MERTILQLFCFFMLTAKASSSCQCGWRNQAPRSFGGWITGVNEFPMMAQLVNKKYGGALACGAVIISQNYALTAAHCLLGTQLGSIELAVGEHDNFRGDETYNTLLYAIDQIIIHQYFQPDPLLFGNDIGLVRVNPSIIFNQAVGPACLPFSSHQQSIAGEMVEIVGWGTDIKDGVPSGILKKVQGYAVDTAQCSRWYPFNIQESMVCTYRRGQSPCQGDSGGPILWTDPKSSKLVVVGIVSRGEPCREINNYPHINVRVSSYLDWIVKNTGETFCYE